MAIIRTILVTCLILFVVKCQTAIAATPPEVDLATIVKLADEAVKEQAEVTPQGFPGLRTVEISLNVGVAKDGEGKLKFFVFSIGPSGSSEKSSKITLLLNRPELKSASLQSIDQKEWKLTLAKAIALAKQSFVHAQSVSKSLKTRKVEIEMAFIVKVGGGGGIDTGDLLPVGIEFSGHTENSSVHTLKLTFGDE